MVSEGKLVGIFVAEFLHCCHLANIMRALQFRSGCWLAWAKDTAVGAIKQLYLLCTCADVPSPRSVTLGPHSIACKLLLISAPTEGRRMTLAGLLAIYQDGFDVCELQTSRAATLMGHNVLSTTLHQRIQVCGNFCGRIFTLLSFS